MGLSSVDVGNPKAMDLQAEFEKHVSSLVADARLLEAVLHDPGPWTMRFETGLELPAEVRVEPPEVRLLVDLPVQAEPLQGLVELLLRGVVLSVLHFRPEPAQQGLTWLFRPRTLARS